MEKFEFQKILFLNPPYKKGFSRSSRFPSVTRSGTLYYPIWLSYAAGCLEKEEAEIKLVDTIADKSSIYDALKIILDFKPDIIVTDVSYESIGSDIKNVEILDEHYPDGIYILCGCHTTAQPGKVLEMSTEINAVLIGEYENTLLDICKGKNFSTINGFAFRDSRGKVVIDKQRNLVKNLDDIPFVSKVYKQHLNIKRYNYGITLFPVISILTARGCPYQCSFCLWPQTITRGEIRTRSSENIAEEFLYIKKEMPYVREVFIEDDTFNYSKKRVMDMCEALIKNNNKIKWTCNVRVDLSYEEMVLMKRAGCRLLVAGFESGSQEILNEVNKKAKLEQSYIFMENAKKGGLLVHGCFILGLPGDDKNSMEETIDLSVRLDPDTAQFNTLFVLPGTSIYSEKKNIPVVDIELLKHARRKFYLRLYYALKIFSLIVRSPFKEGRRIFRVIFRFFKYLF